jgi:hypothetical protein
MWHAVAQMVEALRHKPKGSGFDSRRGNQWHAQNFFSGGFNKFS